MPSRRTRDIGLGTAYSRLRRSTRQTTRSKNVGNQNGIPDVYQEMLAEDRTNTDDDFASNSRPAKKRKLKSDQRIGIDDLFESPPPASPVPSKTQSTREASPRPQQVVYDDFEDSDESEVEFEDVELDAGNHPASGEEAAPEKPLQLDLSKSALESPKRVERRRKPVSKAERDMRLDVHKWHLLSLFGHGLHRNSWCNSEEIHALLKPLVSRKLIRLFHVDEAKPSYERNYSFNKGVEEICTLWRQQWQTTVPGLKRAYWREDVNASDETDESEDLDFEDFKKAAQTLRGSRDLGAQLFTALLRSIAVDVRLVFSLQVLPFTGAAKAEIPSTSKPKSSYIHAPAQNYGSSAIEVSAFTPPSRRVKKPKKIVDSPFPVFWTEILTPNQTWSPLDPVARNSIAKPKTQFEPPLSDRLNAMSYVIAFEEDNTVRDVTQRYTQWYNAKTRKLRVESTKKGEQWYTSVLGVFLRKQHRDSDVLEDSELSRRVNSEGMPHNIQDFKNHPVYVLERHMRVNEVLQPKREVGKVNVGTTKNGKIESVYRRQDVHLCRTADAWYRRGRDVKVGEQPLKHIVPKPRRDLREPSAEMSDDEESEGVGFYAEYQTDIYEPPPVIDGQIPKNAYGNLDVYVPSMIPPGAVHVSHSFAAIAAKIVGVDFADAVTGFEFKGRQGTAVVQGIVVAEQFTAAIASVIDGLEVLGSEEVQEARSRILLGMWKKMLQTLRVRDRIETEYGTSSAVGGKGKNQTSEDDEEEDEDEDGSAYRDSDEDMNDEDGGGFMPEVEPTEEKVKEQTLNLQILKSKMPAILPDEAVRVPIKITRSPHKSPNRPVRRDPNDNYNGEEDLFDDAEGDDGEDIPNNFLPRDTLQDDTGGGFLPEDDGEAEGGGGFILDDEPSPQPANTTREIQPISKATVTRLLNDLNPNPNTKFNLNTDLESIHSDAEEDSALQLAIAESLASASTQQPTTITTTKASISNPNPTVDKPDTNTNIADTTSHAQAESSQSSTNRKQQPSSKGSIPTLRADSPLSTTSLLSHDPSEDDEEPEWLNEALDD